MGPKLTKQNIVSLIFLLLDDPAQALDYCVRVEQGRSVSFVLNRSRSSLWMN